MVITSKFVWVHLPKTGGTSVKKFFRNISMPGVFVEDDGTPLKHDSIARYEQRTGHSLIGKKKFFTLRRLQDWLISDYFHKIRYMGLKIPFEPVREGLFYSMRLGGTWASADWWFDYFEIDEHYTPIRLERIGEDIRAHILPLLDLLPDTLIEFPWANKNNYQRQESYFSKEELIKIHQNNPKWSHFERSNYPILFE